MPDDLYTNWPDREVRPLYLSYTEAVTIGDALQTALDGWNDSSPQEDDSEAETEIVKHEAMMNKVDALYKLGTAY